MEISNRLSTSFLKKGLTLALTCSLLTIVFLLFSSATPDTWRGLLYFKPKMIFILFGLVLLSWFVEGARVKLIAGTLGAKISLIEILRINLVGFFTGNITPFTSGSVPAQVYLFHRKGISVGKATAIVTSRIVFNSLIFISGGPILLFLFRHRLLKELGIEHLSGTINVFLFLLLILSFFLVLLLCRPQIGELLVKKFFCLTPVQKVFGPRTGNYCQRVISELKEFHTCLTTVFRRRPLPLAGVILLTNMYWLIIFSIAPAVLIGFGVNIGNRIFRLLLLQFIILFLVSFIPIPGGSGLTEMGFYSLFSVYLPKHLLAVSVVIWRFLSYYLNTLIGGFIFIKLLFKK